MGMLIYHTWLEQQKQKEQKAEKPVEKATEEVVEETKSEPVRKQAGRRKSK